MRVACSVTVDETVALWNCQCRLEWVGEKGEGVLGERVCGRRDKVS